MKKPLNRIVNHRDETTLASAFRRKRFELFISLIAPLKRPVTILDIGGELRYWEIMGFTNNPNYQIIIVNLCPIVNSYPNIHTVLGDATNLINFNNQEVDISFSNSVIEHLGSLSNQQAMAQEVKRVGKLYFIQTPNKHFPLEPHFLVPFFQYYPISFQTTLIQHFNLGWYKKIPNREEAENLVRSHRLLTGNEMQNLFPEGCLYRERVLGWIKSFIAYGPGERGGKIIGHERTMDYSHANITDDK